MSTAAPPLPTHAGVSASRVALPAGPWPTVLAFLEQRFAHIAPAQWAQRMAQGQVLDAHGAAMGPAHPYASAQALGHAHYYRSVPAEPTLPLQAAVVFEDAHLLVADKPHFMPVTPSGPYVQQSLLVQLKRQTGCDDLVPLHRIDRDTAGLVLFGKRHSERDAYHALFRDHAIDKTYHAVAAHRPHQPLSAQRASRLVPGEPFFITQEVAGPPNSLTHLALLQAHGSRALYALRPVTGKRHQLRVHMSAMGLPIEGDPFYPHIRRTPDAPDDWAAPLQLLAQSVRFADPITGHGRLFESQLKLSLQLREQHSLQLTA